ncbi:MAG: glycosyltransferase family 4 protein [Verrucomicrobia bacterium]|nr:glycosyltransferase family 4 protein [Verrucomicrobiota bacterium]
MDKISVSVRAVPESGELARSASSNEGKRRDQPAAPSQVAILTGGGDRHYALGLAGTLIDHGVRFDFIGSNELDDPLLHQSGLVRFLNLRKDISTNASPVRKVVRVLLYYWRLLVYAAGAKPKVFHILWQNKFLWLDRTLVMLYYRALGKRIVFTAHNVNAGRRDGNDSLLNRLTLKSQYALADHILVHTEQMRKELQSEFKVDASKVSVIPYGINNAVPDTALTSSEAKQRLGLVPSHKVVLFFGSIAPYKGLEYLIEAMRFLAPQDSHYRLIIAGRPKNCESYWESLQKRFSGPDLRSSVIERIEYVRDADIEIYFKAADVLVLPYLCIFQSGVLFLGYSFGLPVIASDVGAFRDDVLDGTTGFICRPGKAIDLAKRIDQYFSHPLYRELEQRRGDIQAFAKERHSWTKVGGITRVVYLNLLEQNQSIS